jgi:hypothetical protein
MKIVLAFIRWCFIAVKVANVIQMRRCPKVCQLIKKCRWNYVHCLFWGYLSSVMMVHGKWNEGQTLTQSWNETLVYTHMHARTHAHARTHSGAHQTEGMYCTSQNIFVEHTYWLILGSCPWNDKEIKNSKYYCLMQYNNFNSDYHPPPC